MCGIAGIITKNNTTVDLAELKIMTNLVEHRGPDGEGHFIDVNVGLGHRRLAIIDLSKSGHQPMQIDNMAITYNGEVYNYIEIRKELQEKGIVFNTQTDTEVILRAYAHWGPTCVHKFNGMWAFAIYDKVNNKVFCSRDRFGVKPFYYHENEQGLFFGSEIRQLLIKLKNRKVNRQILFDYIYLGYHHHNEHTFFEGISSLDPGHNLIFDTQKGTYKIERYYELKTKKEFVQLSFEDAEDYRRSHHFTVTIGC